MNLAQIQALGADNAKDRVIIATDTSVPYFIAKGKLGSTAEVHTTPGDRSARVLPGGHGRLI